VDASRALVRRRQPFADLDRRRLPRAVRSEKTEALPRRDREIESVDRDHVAIALA